MVSLISQLVEQEYEEYFDDLAEKNERYARDMERAKLANNKEDFINLAPPNQIIQPKPKVDEKIKVEEIGEEIEMEKYPTEGCKSLTDEGIQSNECQQSKVISTSRFSNYIEIGLKFPGYKKYHLHAFVDSGSGFTIYKGM